MSLISVFLFAMCPGRNKDKVEQACQRDRSTHSTPICVRVLKIADILIQ